MLFANNKTGLYVWLPVPHANTHAALGCVATADSSPPSLDLVRCVDKSILIEIPEGLSSFFVVSPPPVLLMNPSPDEKRPLPLKAQPGWSVEGLPVMSPNGSVHLGVMKVNCHYKSQQQMLFVGLFEARGLLPRGSEACTAYVQCRLYPHKLGKKCRSPAIPGNFPVFNETFQIPLEKEHLATSMLDFKVKNLVSGRKGVEIGRFRIALSSIPRDITKETINSSISWQALQPPISASNNNRGVSFWRVSSLDTFFIGNEHARPLTSIYRFPRTDQEKLDQRVALEKKGLQLVSECGKQLEEVMSKRWKLQEERLNKMRKLLAGHIPGQPLPKEAEEEQEEQLEDDEVFFDQLQEMLAAVDDFYHYTENSEASGPNFRREVSSLQEMLFPIVNTVKMYIHRELKFEFDHFTTVERQAQMFKLIWPSVIKLDGYVPFVKQRALSASRSNPNLASSSSSSCLPPSPSSACLPSSTSFLAPLPHSSSSSSTSGSFLSPSSGSFLSPSGPSLGLPSASMSFLSTMAITSLSPHDLQPINEEEEENYKHTVLTSEMTVHVKKMLEDHILLRFNSYFKNDLHLLAEKKARVKPRVMRHTVTEKHGSETDEEDEGVVTLDAFLGTEAKPLPAKDKMRHGGSFVGSAKAAGNNHNSVASSAAKSHSLIATSGASAHPSVAKAQPKTVLDYFPIVLNELRTVLKEAGQQIAYMYYVQYSKRLMPLVKTARLTPGGCITCVGFLQELMALTTKIAPPDLAEEILGMEICIDVFMDEYDKQSKDRVIQWVSNSVIKEQTAEVKSFNDETKYLYTYGPSDLFLNLNTAFNVAVETHKLKGRALSRVASIYAHVLQYYIDTLSAFFSSNKELHPRDPPFEEISCAKHKNEEKDPALLLELPAIRYLLAQVNNAKLYEENTEELRDYCLDSLDPDDPYRKQLETLFDDSEEKFAVLAEKCAGILSDWLATNLHAIFPFHFDTPWTKTEDMLHRDGISIKLSDLFEVFMNAIEREVFIKYFFKQSAPRLVAMYVLYLALYVPRMFPKERNALAVCNSIQNDRQMLLGFLETYAELVDDVYISTNLNTLTLISQILTCSDVETLTPTIKLLLEILKKDPLTKFHLSLIVSNILYLRGDIAEKDVKRIVSGLTELERSFVKQKQHAKYFLKILIECGTDLLKKQKPYAPYAKVKLTNADGSVVYAKFKTKPIKSERPDWNHTFSEFDPAHLQDFQCFRFEVWDAGAVHELVGTAVISRDQVRRKEFVETEQLKRGVRLDLALDGSIKKDFWNKPAKDGEERTVIGSRTNMVGTLNVCIWFQPQAAPVFDHDRRATLTESALNSILEESRQQREKETASQLQRAKAHSTEAKRSTAPSIRGFFANHLNKH